MTILNTAPRGFGACLFLLVALAPGCAALNLQQPTAAFRSASVSDLSPAGLTANFDVGVKNPNSFDLPINAASYKLALSGVPVGDGQVNPSGSIPAKGELPVAVPVHLRFDQLLQAEKEIAKSGGNVPFDFDGSLELAPGKIPLGKAITVPLHFSGTLPFRDAVTKAMNDPAARADLLRDPSARKFLESVLGLKLLGGIFGK